MLYLSFFISVVSQPAISFSEVIKDMHPPLGVTGLQYDGGGRVHFSADPATVEDVEDQHAKEEDGTNNAHIPGQLVLGAAKQVEGIEGGGLRRSGGCLLGLALHITHKSFLDWHHGLLFRLL